MDIHPFEQYRKNHDLKQYEMAFFLEISSGYYSQIINGERQPSPMLAIRAEQKSNGEISKGELRPDIWP